MRGRRGRRGRCRLLLRGLYTNECGGSEKRDRDQDYCDHQAATATCKGLAESAVVKKPFDAPGETATACHRDSCECRARRGREFEKNLCIRGTVGSLLEAGAIADGLGQI